MALTSLYGQLFTELQTRLALVEELRWIDADFGQLELETDRPPVSFPCALIDFTGSQFSQLLQNIEMADDCVIQIRLAFAPYSNTNFLTPDDSKEKALQFFEIENKIYRILKGWCPASGICQPINRVADATEKRQDSLRVRALLFSTCYEDDTANNIHTGPKPGLQIEYDDEN